MSASGDDRLLRGAEAIRAFINERIGVGEPISRPAIYRLIESGKIPTRRMGNARTEIWATEHSIERAFGLRGEA